MLAVVALGVGLIPATTSAADRLKDVQAAITDQQDRLKYLGLQAEELAAEIARLQEDLVTAAKRVQEREEELTRLEKTLAALQSLEQEKSRALTSHQGEMTQLLGALQRLSLEPRETLVLGWRSPLDTVVTAQLLGFAVPPIEAKARRLRTDLAEIADLREQALRQRQDIAKATESLKTARQSLQQLVVLKSGLHRTTEDERLAAADRVRALTEQADDLRELLAALPPAAAPQGEDPTAFAAIRLEQPKDLRGFPTKRVGLTPPVSGGLLIRFGDQAPDGSSSHGVTFETQPEGQIVAPHDGQIVFRGPFRGYGEILIMEHRGGYHTLLAGLGRTDVVVGQWLLAGEPIGVTESPKDGKARLYIELRRHGRPIDPWPWLEAHISKVE
ncbi:MAG: murein hydrolase activator EnvC family protein [Dongiaceae bacterium]